MRNFSPRFSLSFSFSFRRFQFQYQAEKLRLRAAGAGAGASAAPRGRGLTLHGGRLILPVYFYVVYLLATSDALSALCVAARLLAKADRNLVPARAGPSPALRGPALP
jgi:hypothetical protein